MRTAGKKKAGFYPTPLSVIEQIASFIERPIMGESYRLFDPCCGKGEALQTLAAQLGIRETYGIELEQNRAKEAGEVLKRVVSGSYESFRGSWKSFSLLFLNPPYDYDEESKRLEYRFLTKLTPYLQEGGLLVYFIVQKHLNKETARYLSTHFENIQVRRFPDAEYEAFKQVIIFGTKKSAVFRNPKTERELGKIVSLSKDEIPSLEKVSQPFYQLVAPAANFDFYLDTVNPEQALAEIRTKGLLMKGVVTDIVFPNEAPRITPLMPLRKGHVAMLMSAGYLNNVLLDYKGRKMIIKGRCIKNQVRNEMLNGKQLTVSVKDSIEITIKGLFLDNGELITIK